MSGARGSVPSKFHVSFAKGHEVSRERESQILTPLPSSRNLGYMATPMIVIDGSVIVGFDAEKIDQALQS